MMIQFVKFKSGLSPADVQRVMRERAPRFRALPGLVQKYYAADPQTGEFCGMYFWDSAESLREFQQTELARTIPVAYEVIDRPRVEVLEVMFPLRG
jgi:hypothetical protein